MHSISNIRTISEERLIQMRILQLIFVLLWLLATICPLWAYSPLAEGFLIACRETEAPFPPEGWSDEDLRAAALEVLDAWDEDSEDSWAISFCLQTIGYAGYEEDIDRILAYEEDLPRSVARALRYVTHPKSIECFLRWLDAEDTPERELALMGLNSMNYEELSDAEILLNTLRTRLLEAREVEPKDRLVTLIDEILHKIVTTD
jgi:hypothetical protein